MWPVTRQNEVWCKNHFLFDEDILAVSCLITSTASHRLCQAARGLVRARQAARGLARARQAARGRASNPVQSQFVLLAKDRV